MSKEHAKTAKNFGCLFHIGRWGIMPPTDLLKYYLMRLHGRSDYPQPSLIVPLDGWIDTPKDILSSMMDDPDTEIVIRRRRL